MAPEVISDSFSESYDRICIGTNKGILFYKLNCKIITVLAHSLVSALTDGFNLVLFVNYVCLGAHNLAQNGF